MPRQKQINLTFTKDQVIVVGEGAQAQVFKVVEDFDGKAKSGKIKASLLKETQRADGKVVFTVDKLVDVPVADQPKRVFDVEVIPAKGRGRTKVPEQIQFNQNQLERVVKEIKGRKPQSKLEINKKPSPEKQPQELEKKIKGKKALLEAEQEEKKPVKRKGGKNQSPDDKGSDSQEESSESSIQEVKPKRGRKPLAKTQPEKQEKKPKANSSDPKKQIQQQQNVRSLTQDKKDQRPQRAQAKKVRYAEESQLDQSKDLSKSLATQTESSEIVEKKKPKKPKKLTQKQEEALKRNGGFKPGHFNPNYVNEVNENVQLESASQTFKDYQSVQINNKEVIRAAVIRSQKLLEDILSKKQKISSLFERWGPENNFNALEVMFKNGDVNMVEYFCKRLKERKIDFTCIPQCSLKEIDTGYNDQHAYGVRTRKVTTGRGNRQGNNAFISDLNPETQITQQTIRNLLMNPKIVNTQLYDKLLVSGAMDVHLQHQIFEQIPNAVRAGNHKVAKHLVEKALKAGNTYGYNWLHSESLGNDKKKLADIKKVNCTKKLSGMMQVTPIHMAAINPDPTYLKKILELSQEYNVQDELGRKPIHYAAVSDSDLCLQYLLDNRADPREGDKLKFTPLMLASQYGRIACVRKLIASCSENINVKNREGNAAIHLAAQNGHLDCVEELLAHGALPKQPGQNRSQPIHLAAAYGHYEVVRYLREEAGVNINSKDKYGRTPLIMAARNGNLQILSYLLKNGADYRISDSSGNGPMHYAAAYGFAECLLELKKAGGDQNLNNSWHLTPLSVALAKNHYSIVREILNFPETDVNCKDDEGKTLLISSLVKFQIESLEYIKFLIEEKNAVVTEEDQLKKTALHYAAQLSAKTYKRSLFEYQQMPKSKRQQYKHNYRNAILELIKLLISRGACINSPDSLGVTPFMIAIRERQTDLIEYFIEFCNPDYSVKDGSDKNLLHLMIDNKYYINPVGYEFFKRVLQNLEKELVSAPDEQGFTPFLYMIKEFTSTTTQLYQKNLQSIVLEAQLAKMEDELSKIDPQLLEEQNNQPQFGQNIFGNEEDHSDDDEHDYDEEDEDEDNIPRKAKRRIHYARTKTTARYSSFAGKAPIQAPTGGGLFGVGGGLFGGTVNQPATQFQGLIGHQVEVRTYGQFSFKIGNNQYKTIGFTHEEYKHFQDQAMVVSLEQEDRLLDLIMQFLDRGASLNEYVRKNKQYRKHNPKKVVTTNPYNAESKKQMQHYIFQNFPNKQFLENLQSKLGGYELDFNLKSKHGQTPLHLFCLNPNNASIYNSMGSLTIRKEFLQYILDNLEIDIHMKDEQGKTATHILAVNFDEPLLDILLEKGGEINIVSKDNIVPIIYHVNKQNVQVVTKLLQRKADPNFQDLKLRSSLHHAINISSSSTDASFDMEDLLFENGARANIRDIFKRTPLYYCFVKIGKEYDRSPIDPSETVSSLLAQNDCEGNVKDIFKRTPLHYAAMRDSVYSASYLVKQKKDVELDGEDQDGNTPIALAFLCGHQNFVKTMIDSQAVITRSAIYNDRKKLEADYIKEYKEKHNTQFVDLEIDYANIGATQNQQAYKQPRRTAKAQNFGGFGFGAPSLFGNQPQEEEYEQNSSGGINLPTKFSYIPVPSTIKPDKYTFFKLAITHGWQNIAYLLIQSGFDLFIALEDSLKSQQFQLVKRLLSKVREDQVSNKRNQQGQNLFHLFSQFGMSADHHIYEQILGQLEKKNVPRHLQDNFKRSPLHYAAKIGFNSLQYYLLGKKVDPNQEDIDVNTPYSYALQRDYSSVLSKFYFPQWQAAGFDINTKFKVDKKDYKLDTFMYLIQEKQIEDEHLLDALLQYGADINSVNQDRESALYLTIRWNNDKLFIHLLSKSIERKVAHNRNKDNQTAYHVVVQPLSYGSFENTKILEALIESKLFGNINETDNQGRTPLDYAVKQKTGKMARILKANGAQQQNRIPDQRPAIEDADYPEDYPDFETHAKEFIEENQNNREEDKSIIDPRLEVDPQAKQQAGKYEILVENGQPYSLIMTKVDVMNGLSSENLFYKMQLIHETNKDVYILFTRWGRIGTPGQLQMTPFDKPNAIKEFHSIFKSKSGNIWEEIVGGKPFQKQPKKYLLLNLSVKKNYKQLMQPFDFSKKNPKPYPQHYLEKNVARFLLQFCQVKLYQRELQQIRVDHEFLPLESLEKEQLQRAKLILKELEEFALDLEKERKKENLNDERIFELFASINEKSSRYYEMIPCIDYRTEPLPPLESIQQIRQQSMIVETLLNFEVTSKILLGALKYSQFENPLTYCFKSMQIRVQTLTKNQPEFQMVNAYVKVTSGVKISNIFAVERKNETERFNQRFQDLSRQLLWHGSKISNFMAILTQGLKIAPPWAYATGAMFGKGIYFADTFEKSYGYTQDYTLNMNRYGGFGGGMFGGGFGYNNNRQYNNNQTQYDDEEQNEIQRYRYLLLCEVATGKMKELREPTNVENFQDQYYGFDSIKGCGTSIPDPNSQVLLEDGTILPQGKIIQVKPQNEKDIYHLAHNEYIVYDEAQVRIRYLVQIDTQNQEDKFL